MGFIGSSTNDFLSLLSDIEVDKEWHKSVTERTFSIAMTSRVAPLKTSLGITKWPLNGPIFPGQIGSQSQTCGHCHGVLHEKTKHVLNYCPMFKNHYHWRKANVINYIDSSLDHNRFKAFCDLPDRRTANGGTIPAELLPMINTSSQTQNSDFSHLKPDLVVVDRQTNDVFIFVISIVDEKERAETQKTVCEDYNELVGHMTAKADTDYRVNFHTIEIGSSLANLSETAKFALWQAHKLTTRSMTINVFIDNVMVLTKLGSFKIYKMQNDPQWNDSCPYLFPTTVVSKKKNIVKMYLIQAGKFVGISLIFVAAALALHIGYLVSGWVWANLTFKILLVIYVVIMGLFLSLFRP